MMSSLSVLLLVVLLLYVPVCEGASKRGALLPSPFLVGSVQDIQYSDSIDEYRVLDPQALRVRLPWVLTAALIELVVDLDLESLFKYNEDDGEPSSSTGKLHSSCSVMTSKDVQGGEWCLIRDANNSNSDLQYLFANDQEAHDVFLDLLANTEFDTVLEAIGTHMEHESLQIYSMGIWQGSYNVDPKSGSDVLHSHLPVFSGLKTYQLVVPLEIKGGSRPELFIRNAKIKSELDVGIVVGDKLSQNELYTPGQYDYRDSPKHYWIAFGIHLLADARATNAAAVSETASSFPVPAHLPTLANIHWNEEGSASLSKTFLPEREPGEQSCPSTAQDENSDSQVCASSTASASSRYASYDWRKWTFREFNERLNCLDENDDIAKTKRALPDEALWKHLQQLYEDIVGKEHSSLKHVGQDSFSVNVTAGFSPGKGRGIFAAQDISAGSLVYSSVQQARFEDGLSFKIMVMSVPSPISCDLLSWLSFQNVGGTDATGTSKSTDTRESTKAVLVLDLDAGSLVNSGVKLDDTMTLAEVKELREASELVNVGCIPDAPLGCALHDYALSDIVAGEELLIAYEDYAVYSTDVWAKYGLFDPEKEQLDVDFDENEVKLEVFE